MSVRLLKSCLLQLLLASTFAQLPFEHAICSSSQIVDQHDGLEGDGDFLFWDYVFPTNEQKEFFVDEHTSDVIVKGFASGSEISFVVAKDGIPIIPSSSTHDSTGWYRDLYKALGFTHGFGKYTIIVSSDNYQQLELEITSPTALTIDGGFVVDATDDSVQEGVPQSHQGVSFQPKVNTNSYFAFQVSDVLRRPGKATSVSVCSPGSAEQTHDVIDRYGCTAFEYSGTFTCNDTTHIYRLTVSGFDSRGNQWSRVYPFICEVAEGTTTVAPVVPPPEFCINDGIMMNEGTEKAECYCGQYFEGRICETKRCFHDGIIGYMDMCVCETGYSGSYCQDVFCDTSSPLAPLNKHAIVFVVRTGLSMIEHITKIADAAEALASTFSTIDSSYINSWILVTVSQGSVEMNEYDSSAQFVEALKNIKNSFDTVCNDKLLEGIRVYLASSYAELYRRSSMFVFSDGLPDDDAETRYALYHQLSFFRGQIFFLLANSATGRCTIDESSEAYKGLRNIAQFTHGHVSHIQLDHLYEVTNLLGITLHKPIHIMANDLLDSCKRIPKYQSFFVDETTPIIWISATGNDLKATVIGPDQNKIELQELLIQDDLHVWSVPNPVVGGYLLSIESGIAAPCAVRVYGNGDSALSLGIATELNEDFQYTLPVTTSDAHIVANIAGIEIPDSMQVHAELTLWSNEGRDDKRLVTYASNGVYRDQCSYNLYFGAYKCNKPYQFYYLNVYMTSKSGSIIQRTSTAYCSPTDPTRTPTEDCLNGGYPLSNQTCICPAHYSGKKCENIECLNLGTPIGGGCSCINSFSGTFCEIATCYSRNTDFVFSPNGRSLTFVVQDSISTRSTIRGIRNKMSLLYQDIIHQHRDWISNFQIWRFNDSSYTSIVSSSNPSDFISGMTLLQTMNAHNSDASCQDLHVIPGLLEMLLHPGISYDGIIYLFINGYMRYDMEEMGKTETVYALLENTRVKLNVVMMSSSPCGLSLDDHHVTALMHMAEYTGGEFVMVLPSKAGDVIKSIPTLYRGSYIYDNYVEDCSVVQSFYFPVDSQMQAFTAYVLGDTEEDAIHYYRPSGEVLQPNEVYSVWKDVGMGSRMDQIIRCQTFSINFWIGLNDIDDKNNYVWDSIDGSNLPLTVTKFTNWASGEPQFAADKRCVHDKSTVGWKVASCSEKKRFICTKHAYDAEYEPDETNVGEVLERGIWKMTVKTVDGPCYVQIYGQSGIELYSKFAVDIHEDNGMPEPLANAENNRFISHVTNQRSILSGNPGQLEYAHFYQDNMVIIEARTYQKRNPSGCSFEYISSGFKCPFDNFLSMTTGVDRFGYLYQRIQPVSCFNGPEEGQCVNGVYYEGRCLCDADYTGDFCTIPKCKHGRLSLEYNECLCDRYFEGPTCDIAICNGQSSSQPIVPSPNNKTFVLLIDGSKTGRMAAFSQEIKDVLTAVLAEATNDKDRYTHFTGLVFRDSTHSEPLSDVIESSETSDFINKIMAEYNKQYNPTANGRSIIAALNKVLQSENIYFGSEAWVVTAGYPEDSDKFTIALDAAAKRHAKINFLIVGDESGPGDLTDYNDTRIFSCLTLSLENGGQFYQASSEAGKVKEFWTSVINTLYNTYEISVKMENDCQNGFSEFIQIASKASTLIVDGIDGQQFKVIDETGAPAAMEKIASSKTNAIYKVDIPEGRPGLWSVVGPSIPGFCGVVLNGQSTLSVYIAFTTDVATDGGLHSNDGNLYPIADDALNAVVAHTTFGKLNFAQIFDNDERRLLWSSPLVQRKQCDYKYISLNTFICPAQTFAVAVDGEDDNGYPFRRMIRVHCIGTISGGPTTAPPTQTTTAFATLAPLPCDPTGKYDIFFVFDVSELIYRGDYQKMLEGTGTFLSGLTLGENNVRVAFGTYCDSLYMLNGEEFEWITTINRLNTDLEVLEAHGYTGTFGNNIQSIFAALTRANWRTDAKHIVVFTSSTPWDRSSGGLSFDDPSSLAQQFSAAGGKIIPIGFGPSANETQLYELGKQCTHMAKDIDYYSNVIEPWLAKAVCKYVNSY
uniref:VWFA domain-containing protein n=1 Tax=Syphacia muris TaxID=451379 RepID=A0A0N5AZL9_9BILA